MANSVAPDSWEQQADNCDTNTTDSKFLEGKFSTLNVNAAEFVPSFCINSVPEATTPCVKTSVVNSTVDNTNKITGTTTTTTKINDDHDDTPIVVNTIISDVAAAAATTFVPPETHHG